MIEKKYPAGHRLPRDWLQKRNVKFWELNSKELSKLFEEFAEALAQQNDLPFILDRIPYKKQIDILEDWQEGEEF